MYICVFSGGGRRWLFKENVQKRPLLSVVSAQTDTPGVYMLGSLPLFSDLFSLPG